MSLKRKSSMERYAEKYPGCKFVGFWRRCEYEEDYLVNVAPVNLGWKLEHVHDDFSVDKLPWPADLVDETQSKETLERIAQYLDRCPDVYAYDGYSVCRICGDMLGGKDKSDGTWVWPDGLSHYVREHKVKLPDEFIRWVIYGVQ